MSIASPSPNATAAEHGRRRPAIVESLLGDILQGRLRSGQHLVTQALSERFGVSHTPIREALMTLAGIGVIDLLPNRGATVRRVTAEDVREICQVRQALECEAVRGACGRINPIALESLAARLRGLVQAHTDDWSSLVDEARATDGALHDLIARSSGNAFLAKELGRLTFLFRAFRDAAWEHVRFRNDDRRLAGEAREHLAIVKALQDSDARRAVLAMKRHIQAGLRYWCRALPVESETPAGPVADPPALSLAEEV